VLAGIARVAGRTRCPGFPIQVNAGGGRAGLRASPIRPAFAPDPTQCHGRTGRHAPGRRHQESPEFPWGTFERIGNGPGPASRLGPKIAQPISAQDYTFYKGGTPADASNNVSGNLTIDRLAKSSRQSPMYFANSPTAARRPTLACGYHVRQSEFPSGDQGPSRD
jgi:hypothetical protein